eukprot:7390872-Prymnesium_polylepis.1
MPTPSHPSWCQGEREQASANEVQPEATYAAQYSVAGSMPVPFVGMQQRVMQMPMPGMMPLPMAAMQPGLNGMMPLPHTKPAMFVPFAPASTMVGTPCGVAGAPSQ